MKTITISKNAKTQANDFRKAGQRRLLQDIPRTQVVQSKKRYNRQVEKKACRHWD